jgi:hypothetical protein
MHDLFVQKSFVTDHHDGRFIHSSNITQFSIIFTSNLETQANINENILFQNLIVWINAYLCDLSFSKKSQ